MAWEDNIEDWKKKCSTKQRICKCQSEVPRMPPQHEKESRAGEKKCNCELYKI